MRWCDCMADCCHCALYGTMLVQLWPVLLVIVCVLSLAWRANVVFHSQCQLGCQALGVACSVVTGGVDVPLAAIDETFNANCAVLKQSLRSQALQGQTKGIEVIKQLLLRLDFNAGTASTV